ncbi:MAG TPA: tetratricopeptide repeat protein, partial [Terriglobales bacterium]
TQQRALAAQQLHNSGIYLMRQHNYSGAINEFQKALALTPNDPAIKRDLQHVLDLQKQSAAAGKTSETLGDILSGATTAPGAPAAPAPKQYMPVNVDPNLVDLRGIGPGTPASASSNLPAANANRLNAVITGSDPSTVDLRRANKSSVNSLKSQIDSLFGGPVATPDSSAPSPQDIDQIFSDKSQSDQSSR